MHAERDYLRNIVFPELEDRLRLRRHHLEPVDLRWGVDAAPLSDEAARELLVLRVCLSEIERSCPFMIVLLGDRFGFIPPQQFMEAAVREAGFETDTLGKSITALEIEYGLIKGRAQGQAPRVYLRDPLPYDSMPAATAKFYSDAHSPEAEAAQAYTRLQELKRHLQNEIPDRVHHYQASWSQEENRVVALEEWGREVLEDLWVDLDRATSPYIGVSSTSWQEEECQLLEQFIEDRSRNFVGRDNLIEELAAWATAPAPTLSSKLSTNLEMHQTTKTGSITANSIGRDPSLEHDDSNRQYWATCLLGGPGTGKSAVFAKLNRVLQESDVLLLSHAAGISAESVTVDSMLRRWTEELQEDSEHLSAQNPTASADIDRLFMQMLSASAKNRRIVILIDALNQLEETARAQYLTWMPVPVPENIRVVVTADTASGERQLGTRAGIRILTLSGLEATEAVQLITRVCAQYHRQLNEQVTTILLGRREPGGEAAYASPLWLELAAEELNLLGEDEFLRVDRAGSGSFVEGVLDLLRATAAILPPNVEGLYGRVLRRAEELCGERWTTGLCSMLALGRAGWRESDLRTLVLWSVGEPWDELRFAILKRLLRAHIVCRGPHAQWDFHHASGREAVMRRYLIEEQARELVHRTIADYLELMPSEDPLREAEYMRHLLELRDNRRALRHYGEDPHHLSAATQALKQLIIAGNRQSPNPAVQRVLSVLAAEDADQDDLRHACVHLASLLGSSIAAEADVPTRLALLAGVRDVARALNNVDPHLFPTADLTSIHDRLGDVLMEHGEFESALTEYRSALATVEGKYNNIHSSNGGFEGLARHQESYARQKVATALLAKSDLQQAYDEYRKAALLDLEVMGDRRVERTHLNFWTDIANRTRDLGEVLLAMGDPASAKDKFNSSIEVYRQHSEEADSVTVRLGLAMCHRLMGEAFSLERDTQGALSEFEASMNALEATLQSEVINRSVRQDIQSLQLRIANMYLQGSDGANGFLHCRAAATAAEELALFEPYELEMRRSLISSYVTLGDLMTLQGNYSGAFSQLHIALDQVSGLSSIDPTNSWVRRDAAVIHGKVAAILHLQGKQDEADEEYEQFLRLAERSDIDGAFTKRRQHELTSALITVAGFKAETGRTDRGLQLYGRAAELARQLLLNSEGASAQWLRLFYSSCYRASAFFSTLATPQSGLILNRLLSTLTRRDYRHRAEAGFRECATILSAMKKYKMFVSVEDREAEQFLAGRVLNADVYPTVSSVMSRVEPMKDLNTGFWMLPGRVTIV